MKRQRHPPEEIIKKLEVRPPTYHRWKEQYGGAREETVKRLKELEKENGRLKRIVADMPWITRCSRSWWGEPSGARQPKGGVFARRAAPEGAGNVVSPERKRQAVLHLQEHLKVSERRACQVLAQSRATQRYRGVRREKDAPLVAALRRVSAERPRGSPFAKPPLFPSASSVGERLQRELQQPFSGRVPEPGELRLPAGSQLVLW